MPKVHIQINYTRYSEFWCKFIEGNCYECTRFECYKRRRKSKFG
ncbi:MAG TPA: hypothetical protein VMW36_08295 [Patescibacteria group bacterium]|nr:hypothetical protein [Patescibacteria group bacterium]